MITLRYKRSLSIISGIASVAILLLVFLIPFSSLTFTRFNTPLWWLSLLAAIFLFVVPIGIIFACIFLWFYRIDFHDSFLEIHTGRLPLLHKTRYAYEDIILIKRMSSEGIGILPRKGKTLVLLIDYLEGGEVKFFDTLMRYIPPERFQPGIRNFHKNLKRFPKYIYAGIVMMLACQIGLWIISFPALLSLPLGWNYFDSPPNQGWINGVSFESPDSLWIVRQASGTTTLEHITHNGPNTWHIPNLTDYYVGARVLLNSQQQPVIVTSSSIYSLKDGTWQKQDFKTGQKWFLSLIDGLSDQTAEYWAWSDEDGLATSLIHIQADNPQPQTVKLLNPKTQKPIKPEMLKVTADGTVLVLKENVVYLLQNGQIQSRSYPIIPKDGLFISDITLINNENLYVLLSNSQQPGSLIEKIDAQGKQTFTELPTLFSQKDVIPFYTSLGVDRQGRLWMAGSPAFMKVLEPVWGGTARHVVTYDLYNSNYNQTGTNDVFSTQDGRIWITSTFGRLIWIDSNAENLPAPLPGWVAYIRQENVFLFSVIGAIQLVFGVLMWITTRRS